MGSWPRDLYVGPGGGLYTGPGGGLYKGSFGNHFHFNWPPIPVLVAELEKRGMTQYAAIFRKYFQAAFVSSAMPLGYR